MASCNLHYGFENVKEEFQRNKIEINRISYLFYKQDNLLSITRRDYNHIFLGKLINLFSEIKTEYFLISTKHEVNNSISFEVEGDERDFFNVDYSAIKFKDYDLKSFLEKYNISADLFNDFKNFLHIYGYRDILKERTDEAILIHIGALDGLLYSLKQDIVKNNPRYEEIVPFGDNWYYFREKL